MNTQRQAAPLWAVIWIVICASFILTSIASASVDVCEPSAEVCDIQEACTASAFPDTAPVSNVSDRCGTICVYHFYGNGCPHCERIRPFIEEVAVRYPQIEVTSFEIYFNATNQEMFRDILARYEAPPTSGVPAVFIGEKALIGERAIRDRLDEEFTYAGDHEAICPAIYTVHAGSPQDVSPGTPVDLTVAAVVAAALIDSINPCAFAVMIFLLTYLVSLNDQRRVLAAGLIYISAVFIVYFISGIGLFVVVQGAGIASIVAMLAAVIAIIAGIINIVDAIWNKADPTLAIPASQKDRIRRYVTQATLPAAFLLGALVSIVELPCTGGVYLAILGLLSSSMTVSGGIPWLLLYNVIFVAPLIIILLVVYAGVSAETLDTLRGRGKRVIRGAIGVFLVILGMLMLSGIL